MFFAPWTTKRTTFYSNDNNKYDNLFDNIDNKSKIGFMVSDSNRTLHNMYVLKNKHTFVSRYYMTQTHFYEKGS